MPSNAKKERDSKNRTPTIDIEPEKEKAPCLCMMLFFFRAIDGARTRGLDLGKVARYQLRHYRILSPCLSDLINIPHSITNVNTFFQFFTFIFSG